jgi:hypothetical protein
MLGMQAQMFIIAALHFLQKHHIRSETMQTESQLPHRVSPREGATFVDVVADNTEQGHLTRFDFGLTQTDM